MADFRYNKVLLALIAVGLLAAGLVAWQRHNVEEQNSRVEMVMDYEDAIELAQLEGVPAAELLPQLKTAGVTSLAVYETTLKKLHDSGKLTVLSGAEVIGRYRSGAERGDNALALIPPGQIAADKIYVLGTGPVFAEVHSDLVRRLGPSRVQLFRGTDNSVLAVAANYEKVIKWNLGLPTDEMREVAGYGFFVVARPSNYTKVRPDDVDAVFDRIAQVDNVSSVMFVGEEALGYPDLLPQTAARLKEQNLTLAMIEHPLQLQFVKQEGLLPLAAQVNYQAARVYVIPKDEQPKLKLDEAIHRWALTDQERNIRINLLRKYDKPEPGKTLIETNLEYITGVKDELVAAGFTLGRAGVYQPYTPAPWLLALIILGATAAGVLFLTLVRPFAPRYQYLLTVIIAAILIFPVLRGGGTLVRQAAAMVSAITFPVLAMTWQLDRWRQRRLPSASLARIIWDGVVCLTVTVLLSLVGGLYVGALLGDIRFLLEMEIYRGVKLTFVGPLLLITIIYLTRFSLFANGADEPQHIIKDLGRILNFPVYVKTMLVLGVAAIVAWVFIGRSGHTAGVPVPAIELKFRALLENLMYARPRQKEFMIGHPAMLLLVMAAYRAWPRALHYVLVVLATIGQGSLVETFAHIRTPFFMSLMRAFDGLFAGVVVGIIAVIGVQVLQYLTVVLGRRTAGNE